MRFLKWEMGERPKVNAYLLKTDVISNRYVFMASESISWIFGFLCMIVRVLKTGATLPITDHLAIAEINYRRYCLMCPILPARHDLRPYTIHNTNR